jgi:hypothetical protein
MTTIRMVLAVFFFTAAIITYYSEYSRLSFALLMVSVICVTY